MQPSIDAMCNACRQPGLPPPHRRRRWFMSEDREVTQHPRKAGLGAGSHLARYRADVTRGDRGPGASGCELHSQLEVSSLQTA